LKSAKDHKECSLDYIIYFASSFIDAQADDDADEDVEANEMMNRCAPKQI
jgi:hypothetical protein